MTSGGLVGERAKPVQVSITVSESAEGSQRHLGKNELFLDTVRGAAVR